MNQNQPTNQDILNAVNKMSKNMDQSFTAVKASFNAIDERFDYIDDRFDYIDNRFNDIENELKDVKSTMQTQYVTKDYLDKKIKFN